jgi:hypothetical protein
LQFVEVQPGETAAGIDTETIHNNIARLRIFSEQRVTLSEISDGGACRRECELLISVKEKFSLYPVPVYVKYRDTEIGGAFLVESNLFGQNKGGVMAVSFLTVAGRLSQVTQTRTSATAGFRRRCDTLPAGYFLKTRQRQGSSHEVIR